MLCMDKTIQEKIKRDEEYRLLVQGVIISCNKLLTKLDVSMCRLWEIDNGEIRRIILDVFFDTDTVDINLEHVEYLHKLIDIEIGSNTYAPLFNINMNYKKNF